MDVMRKSMRYPSAEGKSPSEGLDVLRVLVEKVKGRKSRKLGDIL